MVRITLIVFSIAASAVVIGPITTTLIGVWQWYKVKRARKITRRRMREGSDA